MTSLGGRANPLPTGGARRALLRSLRIAAIFIRDPHEAWGRARDQIAERRDLRQDVPSYAPNAHWAATLRETVGDSAEGDTDAEFEVVWREVEEAFAELHLPFGRAAFGGWDDGDPELARATWLVIRALRPKIVVETGVGRGVTTRVILQALARNRHGHLWSIDIAPLLKRELADQTAAIVPELYSKSWTFVRGSSRRRLGDLVAELGFVDVFLHDSFHSRRNLLFEWETVLPRLRRPGALLADDVQRNAGLAEFTRTHPALDRIVCSHSDGAGLFAVLIARN